MSGPSSAPDPHLGKVYGHWRLEKKLGEGGMGVVYLARHTTLKKPVAVKVLRQSLNSDPLAGERFLREARSAARVEHPSVVQVHHVGQAGDTMYIVMEYVDGITLESALQKQPVLSTREAARIMKAVCEGVRQAHHMGIIHRDIKPDNILLGKDGTVKLADFGLARLVAGDSNLSQSGRIFGTPHFMSPEQALGTRLDHKSDIFSLGATFFRLVTGRYPFPAPSIVGMIYRLTHESAPTARQVSAAVPGEVSDLISEMMAREPAQRMGSVDEVLCRLEEAMEGSRPPSPASSVLPRAPAPVRRRHGRRLAVTMVLVLGVASAFVVLARMAVGTRPFSSREAAAASGGAADLEAAIAEISVAPDATAPPADRPVIDQTMLAERELVQNRANQLLRDLEHNPSALSGYLVPDAKGLKGEEVLRRFGGLISRRAPGAAAPEVAEVSVKPGARMADVTVRGVFGRTHRQRWLKRGDEWYIAVFPRPALPKGSALPKPR